MDEREAQELFDGLIELLDDATWRDRLTPLVDEVRAAIARGKPAAGEVRIAGKRGREAVRRVEPLSSIEQLELLVGAIEFALVVPVDLAAATAAILAGEDHPVTVGSEQHTAVDLLFERDSASAASGETPRSDVDDQLEARDRVRITAAELRDAAELIAPLRQAILSIRDELR